MNPQLVGGFFDNSSRRPRWYLERVGARPGPGAGPGRGPSAEDVLQATGRPHVGEEPWRTVIDVESPRGSRHADGGLRTSTALRVGALLRAVDA